MAKKGSKNREEKPMTNRGVRFTDEQWEALCELGIELDRENGYLVREAVDEYLERRRRAKKP